MVYVGQKKGRESEEGARQENCHKLFSFVQSGGCEGGGGGGSSGGGVV